MSKLVVVVVSWNTSDLTRDCLTSLFAELALLDDSSEVWVVDNASADDSVAMIKNRFPQAILIENAENVGFARANNQALNQARGALYLLLNSDTVIKPGSLKTLLTYMDTHPEAAAIGPRLIMGNGEIQHSFWSLPSKSGELRYCLSEHFYPFAGAFRCLFCRGGIAMKSVTRSRQVEVLSAACVLIRREVFEKIGLLAEAYFLFSEENDLFYRMQAAGFESHYVPAAEIIHLVGQSRKKRSMIDSEVNFLKSRLTYFHRTNRRSFTFVRASYAVFLGWSCALAWVTHVVKGRHDGTYVELYTRLLQTLSEL